MNASHLDKPVQNKLVATFPQTPLTPMQITHWTLLDKCDVVWENFNKTMTTWLQKLQNLAARWAIFETNYDGMTWRLQEESV